MAYATKQSETVETIKSVTLELTLEEARTLAVVYSRVGGSDGTFGDSPRRHCASVCDALEVVGVFYGDAPEYDLLDTNSDGHKQAIYFSDYATEAV